MDSMRRAFKVATVFTGAAAAAAAFTPAALAATAAGAHRMEPATSIRNCDGNLQSTTSMVFKRPPSAHHGPTCIGDGNVALRGIGVSPEANYGNYCTGNNTAAIHFSGDRSKLVSPLEMPKGGLGDAFVSLVSIWDFGGTEKCPIPGNGD
jgi:hypothetical protein